MRHVQIVALCAALVLTAALVRCGDSGESADVGGTRHDAGGGNHVVITEKDGVAQDTVSWNATFPFVNGSAIERKAPALDGNAASSWQRAPSLITFMVETGEYGGDRGSPGRSNYAVKTGAKVPVGAVGVTARIDAPLELWRFPVDVKAQDIMAFKADDYDPHGCLGALYTGPDLVYSFSSATAGTWKFTVTPMWDYNPILYVFDSCPPAGNCADGTMLMGKGQPETLQFDAQANKTYYLFVDGDLTSGDDNGTFTLKVEKL